jgi:SpoIID/LytB domain protein
LIPSAFAESTEPKVQVKLKNYIGYQSQLTIQATGEYIIDQTNIRLIDGKTYKVKYDNGKVLLLDGSKLLFSSDHLNVLPLKNANYLTVNNRAYLGSFQFIPESSKYIRPINEVYLEDYLKGVVPFEMMGSWNREALKAQAVAARTYALSYQSKVIDDTINYQVYGGYAWYPNATAAVDETMGKVLKVNGSLISAVYSASNGGKTESNANVWGTTPVSYLTIKNDEFDSKTPWQFSVKKHQFTPTNLTWDQMKESDTTLMNSIKSWMLGHGFSGKEIKITDVPVLTLYAPTSGGRVSKGDITVMFLTKDKVESTGAYIPQKLVYTGVSASQIRAMVGIPTMLSYLVTNITNSTDSITVSGLGNGHGVGLSQWGAKNRADAGQSYNQILAFYYEGATLVKQYSERVVTDIQAPPSTTTDQSSSSTTTSDKTTVLNPGVYLKNAQTIKTLFNGKSIEGSTQGIVSNGTTHIMWKVVKQLGISYQYKGNGLFLINGKLVQGKVYNGDTYLPWNQIIGNRLVANKISGGWNFTTYIQNAQTIKTLYNGQPIEGSMKGIVYNGTTHIMWKIVKQLGVSYQYKGNGLFIIDGKSVEGKVYNGDTYLPWNQIIGNKLVAKKISGGWNFVLY